MEQEAIKAFREEMYHTQAINEDLELANMIAEDMGYIWREKGGEEGMYESFPITFSRDNIEKEYDEYNDYLDSNCHHKIHRLRSYALTSSGGVAIIEYRDYRHFDDTTNIFPSVQDSYISRQQIVTLGEDDASHFLNGRRIYEDCHFNNNDDFLDLVNMAVNEFKNSFKSNNNL